LGKLTTESYQNPDDKDGIGLRNPGLLGRKPENILPNSVVAKVFETNVNLFEATKNHICFIMKDTQSKYVRPLPIK
jgi:hypothetical protein